VSSKDSGKGSTEGEADLIADQGKGMRVYGASTSKKEKGRLGGDLETEAQIFGKQEADQPPAASENQKERGGKRGNCRSRMLKDTTPTPNSPTDQIWRSMKGRRGKEEAYESSSWGASPWPDLLRE